MNDILGFHEDACDPIVAATTYGAEGDDIIRVVEEIVILACGSRGIRRTTTVRLDGPDPDLASIDASW